MRFVSSTRQDLTDSATVSTVDGRKSHAFLEIGKDYANWIKAQIKRAKLIENEDFATVAQKGVGGKIQGGAEACLAIYHFGLIPMYWACVDNHRRFHELKMNDKDRAS